MDTHGRTEFSACTDTGLVRSHNEDSIAISPDYGLAILADGMGGYNAGEVASGMATAVLKMLLEDGVDRLRGQLANRGLLHGRQLRQLLSEAIEQANIAIFEAARAEPQYSGMGTTLVVALFHGASVTIAHVGDSRAYRLRDGQLVQLTRDHSLLQEQIDAGLITVEAARFSEYRNLVTRAVGIDAAVAVEVHEHHAEPEDLYLLCSDGLSDMLVDEDIGRLLTDGENTLEERCAALIRQANHSGGRDNISVILARLAKNGDKAQSMLERILRWVK